MPWLLVSSDRMILDAFWHKCVDVSLLDYIYPAAIFRVAKKKEHTCTWNTHLTTQVITDFLCKVTIHLFTPTAVALTVYSF